ncbi:MAG TPA: hypothetical protein VJ603_08910, partial [Paucimonas sp.]|nr:hypothetical protein [Paucimonas sp.]
MKTARMIPVLLAAFLAVPVFAQSAGAEAQRDVRQQQRIENGLQSGQLTTREAARLEREEAQIDRAQAHALKDGRLSNAEKSRIERMQDHASRDIRAEKHDAQTDNPGSASSRRMQADVQRNVNQEQRIANGLKDGSLTKREAARMERGQAGVARQEFRDGRDGHIGRFEQRQVQRSE